jgi:nucleoside-diphosphate-sugar epimerase
MKILLAGATGAIGIPLTRQLSARGHQVIGVTRRPEAAAALTAMGAQPVVADVLDRGGLVHALRGISADAVIHELTALKSAPARHGGMVPTDRLRIEGTTNLLVAADVVGATTFVTQSIIMGYGYRDHGDRLLTEDDSFGQPAGDANDPHIAAMLSTEQQAFTAPVGIALRYGLFYGGDVEEKRAALAKRAIPVARGGLLGWIHHEDAAVATVAALERGQAGNAYNIVDDRPATWKEVFTAMAQELGTPPPRNLPRWVLRLVAPYVTSFAFDTSMRVSNAKAKHELGWSPKYPTYQEGIAAVAD